MIVNKHSRWRHKNRARGYCLRCAKPAAPYALCETHRHKMKVYKIINKLVKLGAVRRTDGRTGGGWEAHYQQTPKLDSIRLVSKHSGADTDRRLLPRTGLRGKAIMDKDTWAKELAITYKEMADHEGGHGDGAQEG